MLCLLEKTVLVINVNRTIIEREYVPNRVCAKHQLNCGRLA